MLPPEALYRFVHRQKRLLRSTYDAAWQQGVSTYQPDADPQQQPSAPRHVAEAGLAGAALLAARRAYPYVPPVSPDPVRRAVSLAPSFASLNRMHQELMLLAPDPVAVQAAAVEAGARGAIAQAADVFARALQDWASSNAYRLDAGSSVAWAGMQSGYGEAADQDGMLLGWDDEQDDHECEDCQQLAGMPPMALADWPCQPGDGTTACNIGCRCKLSASDRQVEPGDTYAPELSDAQQATMDKLTTAQADAMNAMMPDAQYLD